MMFLNGRISDLNVSLLLKHFNVFFANYTLILITGIIGYRYKRVNIISFIILSF